jgi:hypothetical protein
MMEDLDRDPAPDPRLAAALGGPEPPEPEWERLRAAIGERAALPLARRRRAARVRSAARRERLLVPTAAAAALALYLGGVDPFRERAAAGAPGDTGSAAPQPALVEEVVRASLPTGELDRLISGSAEREALLLAAVGRAEQAEL